MADYIFKHHIVDAPEKVKCDQSPLEHAIMELISARDFDGYLLLKFDCRIIKEIPDASCQTAALMYHRGRFFIRIVEDFFNELTDDGRVAIMKHEIAHFIMQHMSRRNGRDSEIFNISADLAINQNIAHLPPSCVSLPKGWTKHLSMEEYYDKIMEKRSQAQCKGTKGKGTGGKEKGDGKGGKEKGDGKGDNLKLPSQFDNIIDSSDIDSSDSESMSNEIIRETVKEQIDAGNQSIEHLRGLHAGALESFIDELTKPPIINWKHALTRFASSLSDTKRLRTLKRPDRRDLTPFGKRKEYLPKLIVCVDTSGSVSDEMLSVFFSQIELLKRILSEVNVVIADATVQDHFVYKRGMEPKLRKAGLGRGGTDFTPAVEYINKNLRDCDGAVYLTDGWCPEPSVKCRVPMIWIVDGNEKFPGRPMIVVNTDHK